MSTIQVNLMADSQGGSVAPISSVMRNRLIDAGFTINQRGYVSGTALSAGTYAHDRFKAGAGGCTYTFTQLSTGVPIVITITAGSLQQVIEGANMGDGGTYVLSWTGTAQAKFNGGAFGSSPLAVTGIVAGANTTIEFGTGTCSFPQLEKGTQATSFEYRQIGTELQLCQRYCYVWGGNSVGELLGWGAPDSPNRGECMMIFPVPLRTNPSVSFNTASNFRVIYYTGGAANSVACTSTGADSNTPLSCRLFMPTGSSFSAGTPTRVSANNTTDARITVSAEL